MTTDTDVSRDYRQIRLDSVKSLCLRSIATMRGFLDNAEREINRSSNEPVRMVNTVQANMAWGLANASGPLTVALSVLEDARRIAESEKR